MSDVRIELCPETGICSVVKDDGNKIDLMPNEVAAIRAAGGDAAAIKTVVAECDATFAEALEDGEIQAIVGKLS
jgi:hypothetical protein